MNRSRYELEPGLFLDARRAVWIEQPRALVIADPHLGYEWAHRHNGQMLPIGQGDDTLPRLHALLDVYDPRTLVLLGDIVHRAFALPPIKEQLCRIIGEIGERTDLKLIAGNHDRALDRLLRECGLAVELIEELLIGNYLLLHGNRLPQAQTPPGGRMIIGHEHPAISISDGVATSAKAACFALGEGLLVLPAFSRWAAGSNIRSHPFQSPAAASVKLTTAVAIMGDKLLPIRLRI